MKAPRRSSEKRSKRRTVRFQEQPNVVEIDYRGTWLCPLTMRQIREAAVEEGRQARNDVRLSLWITAFQEPVSDGLLSMWTTNSRSLRGLEKFVSLQHYHRSISDHRERIRAVVNFQHKAGKISEELAEVSRAYSQAARTLSEQLGKADEFAVAVDELKLKRTTYIRDILSATTGVYSQLPHLPESTWFDVRHCRHDQLRLSAKNCCKRL